MWRKVEKNKNFGKFNEIFHIFFKKIEKISKNALTNGKFML